MKIKQRICFLLTWLIFSLAQAEKPNSPKLNVIYGEDNRLEVFQVPPPIRVLADSTVSLFYSRNVVNINSSTSELVGREYGSYYGLCRSERFYDQSSSAFCSGSLVGDDLILTAGHCVRNQQACEGITFVFDYNLQSPGAPTKYASNSNIYRCKKLIHSEVDAFAADFAVIQLDRRVNNRSPLRLHKNDNLNIGTELFVIGHPAGLPAKIAAGASVRQVNDGFFVANLDTFSGNSGSPVFNTRSNELEGVLVRGENDFEQKGSCKISKLCTQNECRGEDVTKITKVLPYLNP